MKRTTEEQMQLPALTAAYNPLDPHVVLAELPWDWRRCGEAHLVYTTRESLEHFRQALHFLENFVADELWMLDESAGRHAPKENDDTPGVSPF